MSDLDASKMESIVRQAVKNWSSHRDYEDLKQIGRIAYWRESCSDDPDALAVVKVRRRVIDGWRSMNGCHRDKHGYLHGSLESDEELLAVLDSSSENQYLSCAFELKDMFKGKKKTIANMVIEGFNNQTIANHLGLHPSRISQILAEMKKQLILEWINA